MLFRSKMSEVILAASGCRTSVTEAYQSGNASNPPTAGGWGCESASQTSKYVSSVKTNGDGQIRVTIASGIDPALDGKFVYLTPQTTAGVVMTTAANITQQVGTWLCGVEAADLTSVGQFLPGSCKGTVVTSGTYAP